MFWAWDITVPAGRTAANPITQILKLSKGVMTRVDVKFPAGCHGLVNVRLFKSEFQLIPLSKGEWVTGDDETVPTEGYYELETAPAQLKFMGCSPETSYDHTITVRVTVLPKQVASMLPVVDLLTRLLQRMGVIG